MIYLSAMNLLFSLPSFVAPAYLWALVALVVPIAIHLWNRRAGKRILVGSLQWLQMAENTRLSQLRLNQIGLLLLRMMVLAVLVVLLAEPLLPSDPTSADLPPKNWVIASKQQAQNTAIARQIAELQAVGFQWRLPSDGFPPAPESEEKASFNESIFTEPANYWALLSTLSTHQPDSVLVFAPLHLGSLPGQLYPLPKQLKWLPVPMPSPTYALLGNQQTTDNQYQIRLSRSDETATLTETITARKNSETFVEGYPTPRLTADSVFLQEQSQALANKTVSQIWINADPAYTQDISYLKAAIRAAADYAQSSFNLQTGAPGPGQTADLYVWYKKQSPPKSIDSLAHKILIWEEADRLLPSHFPLFYQESGNRIQLNHRLNPSASPAALSYVLPEMLLNLLFTNEKEAMLMAKNDQRQFGEDFLTAYYTAQQSENQASLSREAADAQPVQKKEGTRPTNTLWALLFALLALERTISYKTQS